ncbi:HEAT repeat domain-containing protein [Kovacikia minuta CCNUW1]|uniref:HEAT repeat domain-containing protein n=1 Tax=Kovacikia minuta TaxID=2931930 RepID=UPI001CC9AB11|nr:HEAT repeat domain-containing protein [Kovacikia minuta]UBF29694.1 HEAT repeat domain-containing protein [Kovacikia minuta CCNUW1]
MKTLKDSNAGVRNNSAYALRQLGLDAKVAIPPLIDALKDSNSDVRWNSAIALCRMGAEAKAAVPTLMDTLKENEIYVRQAAVIALWNIDPTWVFQIKWLAGILAYTLLFLLWLMIFWLRPFWLFKANNILKPYTDFSLPVPFGNNVKLPIRFVILVGFFHYRKRVLNAWVSAYIGNVRKGFEKKHTVSDRAIHISMPVTIDKTTIPNLTTKQLQPLFNEKRCCLLITGEGGAGKTSLACQLAKWAMSEEKAERLCKHQMLPVLIEQDLDPKVADGKKPFQEVIKGQLQSLIGESEPITDELLEHLLRQRRVLVIVDHLSEMSEESRKEIRLEDSNFLANALIVTSRLEETLDQVPKTTIRPLRIEGNRLSSFMEAYLTQKGKKQLFTDPEYFDACSQLSRMVGQRNATVLLAKLYAEQMIARKEDEQSKAEMQDLAALPKNIPDLMLSYLNELNRGALENQFDDRTVHQDAKAIAWECLQNTYRPASAKRDAALIAMAGENAEARLKHLENRLRIVQTIGAAQNHVRFTLDPLAEYLAAFHIVEKYGSDSNSWQTFLKNADSFPIEAIQGFLLAVRDCYLAMATEVIVPDFVMETLEQKTGLVSHSIPQTNVE